MHIGMIGPGLNEPGGIASVATSWLGAEALAPHEVEYIGTAGVGSAPIKIGKMAVGQAKFLSKIATGWRPDLFHIHMSYRTSFYRKLVYLNEALATGRPVVIHIHGSKFEEFHDASPKHAKAIENAFRKASRVVVLSEAMADVVQGWMGPIDNVRVLYNPVSIDTFTARENPRTDHRPTVLFMGRIGERKGTWDLLNAIPRVLEEVPNALFRFGGDGDIEEFNQRVDAAGIQNNVEALGWVSGEDKLKAFDTAEVYCLPSYNEGLPVSVLEAMAVGLPVVSTPIAGIPEAVISGVTGQLVKTGDVGGLAEALIMLLSKPEEAFAMGKQGRTRAEQLFALEVVIEQLLNLWQETLEEHDL